METAQQEKKAACYPGEPTSELSSRRSKDAKHRERPSLKEKESKQVRFEHQNEQGETLTTRQFVQPRNQKVNVFIFGQFHTNEMGHTASRKPHTETK
jgi:hypothetical protein